MSRRLRQLALALAGRHAFAVALAASVVSGGCGGGGEVGVRRSAETYFFRIDRPDVSRHSTDYPDIRFAPGDLVYVNAGGCARSSSGSFQEHWKLYVDPLGDN